MLLVLVGVCFSTHSAFPWSPREGGELIGTAAPSWDGIQWLQGGPLTPRDLAGKVILLRFWTAGCPYCTRTAPVLQKVWEEYEERGVVVVALHHPKSEVGRLKETVTEAVKDFDWTFPVGIDDAWDTVRKYGVGKTFKRFTSITFLIDKQGIIRFVHDGGEFHEGGGSDHQDCNDAWNAVRATLNDLVSEPYRAP